MKIQLYTDSNTANSHVVLSWEGAGGWLLWEYDGCEIKWVKYHIPARDHFAKHDWVMYEIDM